jgi:hypothetical protein
MMIPDYRKRVYSHVELITAKIIKSAIDCRVPSAYYFAFFGDVCSSKCRGIAQSGSASGLGPEGREFESLCPDHFKYLIPPRLDILNAPVAHLDRASAF